MYISFVYGGYSLRDQDPVHLPHFSFEITDGRRDFSISLLFPFSFFFLVSLVLVGRFGRDK